MRSAAVDRGTVSAYVSGRNGGMMQSIGAGLQPSLTRFQRDWSGWRRRLLVSSASSGPPGGASRSSLTGVLIAPDQTPDATCRLKPIARLEAVLFLAKEPLSVRRLGQLADLEDATAARTLLRRLNQYYDEVQCAFRAVEIAGGYQLLTRQRFAPWLRRLRAEPLEVRLSPAAMETLAIVAYKQPVLRATIEAIRGVQCGEILRQLMERDLVRIAGRSEELGRPFLYGTTRRFLQVFGLRHVEDLPPQDMIGEVASRLDNPADA